MTPVKSIRKYCVDHCMCKQPREVKLCPCKNCPLWPYRMGKRPTTPDGSEKEKKHDVANGFSEQNKESEG